MNSNKGEFDPLINLKQGAEFLKYGNIKTIDSIEHLKNLQKTSSSNLESAHLYSDQLFKAKSLENYKHVSDYKTYTKEQGLFNKTVSEYMMTHHEYINDTGNYKLFNSLIRLNDKLIKHASNISNSLTKLIITDTALENDMINHKKHIDDSIEHLKVSATVMKPLEKRNNGDSLETMLTGWYSIVGIGIFALIIVVIMTTKTKGKDNIILLSFITIILGITIWLSRKIIL
jgi:hypothetical protein|tara:strand:- start:2589 stop:3278 length:690 start_codon:yes stop_codon:yes gene_type:complete